LGQGENRSTIIFGRSVLVIYAVGALADNINDSRQTYLHFGDSIGSRKDDRRELIYTRLSDNFSFFSTIKYA